MRKPITCSAKFEELTNKNGLQVNPDYLIHSNFKTFAVETLSKLYEHIWAVSVHNGIISSTIISHVHT